MKPSAILRRLESALKNNRTTVLTSKDELRLRYNKHNFSVDGNFGCHECIRNQKFKDKDR
jgi:hypothetical protein